MIIVLLKENKVVPNYVMDMPYDIRLTYKKIDFQLPGNLTDDSVILDTVQLPVKNHLFLDVSSDDLYWVGGDREWKYAS